jgi:hypothetical protein
MILVAQIGFVVLTVVYFGLLLREFNTGLAKTGWPVDRQKRFIRNSGIALLTWAIFVSIWSYSGRMGDFSMFPLNFAPVLVVPLIGAIIFSFSKPVSEILQHIAPEKIAYLQSFRIFVELLLWALFVANALPVQMTFEGFNLDILSGITGPIVGWLIVKNKISRTGVVIWNILCLGLLINIVSIAMLSTPSPIRVFMNEPANTIVAMFPISWLPGFLVPLAYTLSFLSLRQMTAKRTGESRVVQNA